MSDATKPPVVMASYFEGKPVKRYQVFKPDGTYYFKDYNRDPYSKEFHELVAMQDPNDPNSHAEKAAYLDVDGIHVRDSAKHERIRNLDDLVNNKLGITRAKLVATVPQAKLHAIWSQALAYCDPSERGKIEAMSKKHSSPGWIEFSDLKDFVQDHSKQEEKAREFVNNEKCAFIVDSEGNHHALPEDDKKQLIKQIQKLPLARIQECIDGGLKVAFCDQNNVPKGGYPDGRQEWFVINDWPEKGKNGKSGGWCSSDSGTIILPYGDYNSTDLIHEMTHYHDRKKGGSTFYSLQDSRVDVAYNQFKKHPWGDYAGYNKKEYLACSAEKFYGSISERLELKEQDINAYNIQQEDMGVV